LTRGKARGAGGIGSKTGSAEIFRGKNEPGTGARLYVAIVPGLLFGEGQGGKRGLEKKKRIGPNNTERGRNKRVVFSARKFCGLKAGPPNYVTNLAGR